MAFNFSKLTGSGAIATITEPSTLFDALPNKADGYGYLRAVQKTVLDAWSARRDERDLVIKTNTGGGKTIMGLLMLQCSLNEQKGPALYLAPDPHLAQRVCEEAFKLGISVTTDPLATQFLSGEAICVTTMQTLVNGKSRFGLSGPSGRQPITVNTIVIDDAHAALALTEENTTLSIPSTHPTFAQLIELFEEDLKTQGANAFMDVREGDLSAVLRVPFWSWSDKQDSVLGILRPHRADDVFQWAWPLVGDLLPICQAVVTAKSFEIMTPCPPIEKFPSFSMAKRRIYLTATLADDSVLVTHFDADSNSVATSLVPDSASDLGDRLILAPQEMNPDITHDEMRALAKTLAGTHNVVVLVPSWRQAGLWSDEIDIAASTAEEISAAVEKLKSEHVGLVVIVNRYDGIDLPDDACRVLIIDSLPFAYSGIERREAVALRDSEAMVTRQLQRLEQGMGRAVRSRDDRCVVMLIDSRLTQLVARADIADRLSPATRAQLKLSRRVTSTLEKTDVASLLEAISQVIDGDPDFRTLSREALVGITYGPALLSPTAQHLRNAYNAAAAGRAREATEHAKSAVQSASDGGDTRLAGWLGESHAAYLHAIDRVAAQSALTAAACLNPAVIRPLEGLGYEKIRQHTAQAQQAREYLVSQYSSGDSLIIGFDALLADLEWDNSRTDDAESAFAKLGLHLGHSAQQPELEYGIGCDVLWAMGDHSYAVLEAKTGATAPFIWKKDINQLAGSVNWCHAEYGHQSLVTPVIIHPSSTVQRTGTPPSNTRVITTIKLKALKWALRSFARALAHEEAFENAEHIDLQLREYKLGPTEIFSEYAVAARRESATS